MSFAKPLSRSQTASKKNLYHFYLKLTTWPDINVLVMID